MVLRKYEDVIFMDGDEADEVLSIINGQGIGEGYRYLKQWDYGEPTPEDGVKHVDGYPDLMFHSNLYYEGDDGYMMGWNFSFTTVALWRVTDHADYPHEADTLYDCPACDMPE